MKYLIFVFLGTVAGCMVINSNLGKRIEGNGKIVTEEIKAEHISKIENKGVFNIVIKQGKQQKITIETDENILPYLIVMVKDGKISFSQDKDVNIKPTKSVIYLTLGNLSELDNLGTGNITIDDFIPKATLNIINEGTGNIEGNILSDNKILIDNSGTANVNISGKSRILIIDNSGTGNINALEFRADEVSVNNSGTGNVKVFAQENISIKNKGTGSVKYKGSPNVKSLSVKGSGRVKHIE